MSAEPIGIDLVQPSTWQVRYGEEHARLEAKYAEPDRVPDETERNRIFETAARLLSQCPDPQDSAMRRTGLALGKVQSGKTMSYIALTALAYDNGYRVVIVLAGRTDALADQNRKRFQEDLIGTRTGPKIATFHNPARHDQTEIQTLLEADRLILITLLKHQDRIEDVRDMFASTELNRFPVLVIDDEGDQASHNAKRYRRGESAVYRHILQMRGVLPHHAYVSYTATPQASLLAAAIDELAPEFCVLVEPGSGYTGGSTFFGPDRDRFLRIVPDDEADRDDFNGVPDCLRLALATFLMSGALLHLRHPDNFHAMLIHQSNRKEDHRRLHEAVQYCLDGWKSALSLRDDDPGAVELQELLRQAHADLQTTVENCPAYEVLAEQVKVEIKDLKVWIVNSLKQGSNPSTTPFNLRSNIMVGGNMLDRGVTIPGLAITYITRQARNSQADTVEQRARWFGYKRRYLNLCRIFTSRKIAEVYTELLSHEDDFWESLQRSESQGLPVTQWPRLFRLGLGLRPTRSSVARTKAFRSGDWLVETKPTLDPKAATANVSAARTFFAARPDAMDASFGSATHLMIRACDPDAVIELLAGFQPAEDQDWDSSYAIEYLERLVLGRALTEIDVLLMGRGEMQRRTMDARGRINPMEGEREHYPGDRYIHDNRVQLQVHMVGPRDNRSAPALLETTALALYVPPSAQYDLGPLVVPND